jgi:hypothetical protein
VPVTVIVGDRNQVEDEAALREIFARFLPHATFRVLSGIAHHSPLEAPEALADSAPACLTASDRAGRRTFLELVLQKSVVRQTRRGAKALSPPIQQSNHSRVGVFTQPGSAASTLRLAR